MKTVISFLFFLTLAAPGGLPEMYRGKAIRIADGDTFTLLTVEKREIKIRLWGIDAPEKNQAFGTRSKQLLSRLVWEQPLTVYTRDVDRYGRVIGEIILDDSTNVNAAMVRAGMAWWYKAYAPKESHLDSLERVARELRLGVWSEPAPVPPWEFRRIGRGTAAKPSSSKQTAPAVSSQGVSPVVPREPVDTAAVILNTSSLKYHCPSCKGARQCAKNCVQSTRVEAVLRGAVPCAMCGGLCK